MEDHLKNKDRLDREWDAMCGYEADPCSTAVANDQANARKNRYADVLPCTLSLFTTFAVDLCSFIFILR